MSGCGIISDAWTCVKPAGHNGGHVYEMRHVNDSIAAAEERGRSGAETRIAELEHKFHAQRAMVEAAHLAFHEVAGIAYGHTPDEDTPAVMIRLVAAEAEERGRWSGVEERDELRAALLASRPFVADYFRQHDQGITAAGHFDLLVRIDAALAPRDSAHLPTPKMQPASAEQRAAELRRASPRARVNEEEAPRDSGKER